SSATAGRRAARPWGDRVGGPGRDRSGPSRPPGQSKGLPRLNWRPRAAESTPGPRPYSGGKQSPLRAVDFGRGSPAPARVNGREEGGAGGRGPFGPGRVGTPAARTHA